MQCLKLSFFPREPNCTFKKPPKGGVYRNKLVHLWAPCRNLRAPGEFKGDFGSHHPPILMYYFFFIYLPNFCGIFDEEMLVFKPTHNFISSIFLTCDSITIYLAS